MSVTVAWTYTHMGERIGVCLVGFGYAGLTFHGPLVVAAKNLTLACVVTSKSPEEVARGLGVHVPCFATLDEACAKAAFALVVVATPNRTHAALALRAAELGKHVVVDKPFACSASEAEAVLARRGRQLISCFQVCARVSCSCQHTHTAQNRQGDSDFLTARREMARLGEIVQYRSDWKRFRPQIKDNWRWVPGEPASGLLWDLAPHMLHQTLLLFGPPSALFCQTAAQREGAQVDDYFHIVLTYAARPRLVCTLESGCLFHAGSLDERSFFVYGSEGSFEKRSGIDAQEAALRSGQRPRGPGWGEESEAHRGTTHLLGRPPELVPTERSDYVRFFEDVGEAVAGRGPLPVPAEEALAVVRLVEAAVASAAKGSKVTFV